MLELMSDFNNMINSCRKDCVQVLERCMNTESKITEAVYAHNKIDDKTEHM